MKQEENDKDTVENLFIEDEKKRKVKIKVRVETINRETLVGYLFLDKGLYRRVSDYVNDSNIDFLILSDVKDVAKEGEIIYSFLAVNKRHVVMITEI